MRGRIRARLDRLERAADGAPGPNLAHMVVDVLAGRAVSEAELAALGEAVAALPPEVTVEERMAAALGETPMQDACAQDEHRPADKPRPYGLRELRPGERLLTAGDEQERAD
jgi:hypothetical protein